MISEIFDLIKKEEDRQARTVELIASENFVSENVRAALGSCLTNKYAEGYPAERDTGKRGRYYGGCQYIDEIEEKCCQLWKQVFDTDYHVNVQPHSGSSANLAAYMSVLKPGDTILAMDLNNGGHLTHGSKVNFSGKLYNVVFYNLTENGLIDYDDVQDKIRLYRPKLVVAGASAYSREIEFTSFRLMIDMVTTDEYQPLFMVDMAHIAGLVATGAHGSPFGLADIITTTTHKTLRGPRGGLIFCKPELADKIDSAIFPGCQGGPLEHVIAAKAVAAAECLTEEYRKYIEQVVMNCDAFAKEMIKLGYHVVSGGTDNHMFLIDLRPTHPHISGRDAQEILDKIGITLNKNCVPNETRPPQEASGIRIGTAAMTTKGYKVNDFVKLAKVIDSALTLADWDGGRQ
jgi:glycine hydroxymethyltransferase